jgi:NQR2, RnfD, RnfE family
VANVLRRVEKALFEPESLPPGTVLALALLPACLAGLVFFKLYAAQALAIAIALGLAAILAARLLRVKAGVTPLVAAVVAVALAGAAAPPAWIALSAALGAGLELARLRWLPRMRVQAGLVAGVALFLGSRGLTAVYLNPGRLRPLAEPIRLWSAYANPDAVPIDPVRLYVGNVPGPMLATSLLAMVVGAAWLWYARRLSLAVLVAFLVGAAIPITLWRWNAGYQLDSGPTWFAVALVLADRHSLPGSRAARLVLGLAAGVTGVGLRQQGLGVEAMFLTVAGLQLTVAVVEGATWLLTHRRRVAGRIVALRRSAGKQLSSGQTAA